VLDQITCGSMDRARSIASVLHGRLQDLRLPGRQDPAALAERLPEARSEGLAREAAVMMDARTQAIGEQLAARPEPWLVDRLGLPPQQPGALRDDWISRAGRAGFYRQAHGITDPNIALGDRPANNPELLMLWEQTHWDLEIPAEEVSIRAKSRAELEGTVHAYTRAAETAPPDMARQLDHHSQQAAGLEQQAEQAEAAGYLQLASDSYAAAAEEVRQADELTAAQDTRDAWDRTHEANRLAARAARQELDRRGIEPEPEHHEPESLTAWWRQFEADAQAAEQAIEGQRQTAIDAGQPWPPKPAATIRTPDPEAHKVSEELRRDGSLPGSGLQQNERRVGMPEPAELQPDPEHEAKPGREADVSEQIDASIRRIEEAGQRLSADVEAEQQERSGYAARIAQEAQYEAETAHAWPSSHAENRSAEVDYEPEL
jgi:hypothetical protein